VPLCPQQIPHDLTGARTRAAAVGTIETLRQNETQGTIILESLLPKSIFNVFNKATDVRFWQNNTWFLGFIDRFYFDVLSIIAIFI
jgi:hypothetical protein